MRKRNKDKCLNPKCTEKEVVRGLCRNCYSTAMRLVRSGRVTWKKLVDAGKCKNKPDISQRIGWFLGENTRNESDS